MEKDVISKGLSESDLADSSAFGVNDAGTRAKGDTPLTHVRSPDVHGCVYFIRVDDAIKIGSATNFKARLTALQTAHERPLEILGVVPATALDEFKTHQKFAHLRTRGEWFRADRELLQFIDWANVKFGNAVAHQRAVKRPPAAKMRSTTSQLRTLLEKYRNNEPITNHVNLILRQLNRTPLNPEHAIALNQTMDRTAKRLAQLLAAQ